jgi:hypothetical protein
MTFSSKGVVYDETDEVGLAYGHQSADWKRRMRSTDLTAAVMALLARFCHWNSTTMSWLLAAN